MWDNVTEIKCNIFGHVWLLKNLFFFECLYFSEYDIRVLLFVFWLRNRPSIKYVSNWRNGRGSSKMCRGAYRGRGLSRLMCTYALTNNYSFQVFVLRCLVLTFIKKGGCFSQKWLFFSSNINFCSREISFFTLNCFSKSTLTTTLLILIK